MTVGSTWAGSYDFSATALHRPASLDALREVVASASRIRALGTRHSFSGIADSAELVSLDRLPADIRIDEESETVSFSGGVRYGELAIALERAGWALRNLASLPHISVAGAIATGTHGSGDHNGILARAVSGLDLVTADGDLHTITPADPDFDGAVVSLGALGVVARVTLDIEPSYAVRQDVYEGLSWDSLLENLDRITARAYSVSVFTDWNDVRQVWLKSRLDERTPPATLFGARPADGERHMIAGMPTANTTAQRGVPGAWLDRIPHFRLDFTPSAGDELQSEYLIPRQHARAAISAIRSLASRISPVLLVSELRTVAADSLWLSGAFDTDALAIHFTWLNRPDAVAALLPEIEESLAPFAARPHWGKLFHAVQPELYPRLDAFRELATRLDPNGTFRNDFLDRHVFGEA